MAVKIIFVIILLIFEDVNAETKYVSKLKDMKNCTKLSKPFAETAPFKVFLELKNTTGVLTVVGNVIVHENFDGNGVKGGVSVGIVKEDKTSWLYQLDDLDCHSQLARILNALMKNALSENCMVRKGQYHLRGINVNKLDHTVHRGMTREFGNYQTRIIIHTNTHTLYCRTFGFTVMPQTKQH